MDARSHWEQVHATKNSEQVSWFRPHLERSVELIERAAPNRLASILDVVVGPSGPERCSGLATVRYDASSLGSEFGDRFRLVESSLDLHETPSGVAQQFLSCWYRFS